MWYTSPQPYNSRHILEVTGVFSAAAVATTSGQTASINYIRSFLSHSAALIE